MSQSGEQEYHQPTPVNQNLNNRPLLPFWMPLHQRPVSFVSQQSPFRILPFHDGHLMQVSLPIWSPRLWQRPLPVPGPFQRPSVGTLLHEVQARMSFNPHLFNQYQVLRSSVKFSVAQQHQLFYKANHYMATMHQQNMVDWKAVNVLSRAEPDAYYAIIENTAAKIELTYLKNDNGHFMSHINNSIHGLYLSAGPIGKKSPFGNVCYEHPITVLLNVNEYRLYFADFFCSDKSANHKVTLVVCRKNSDADKFCYKRLIELPWADNEYFKVIDHQFYVARGNCHGSVFVDLFYTEAIDLKKGVRKNIEYTGTGDMYRNQMNRMFVGGVKNDIHCSMCNVK